MAENKTRATEVDAAAFLDAVDPPDRRADGLALAALMTRITGEPATMWGPSIVGFGRYRYRYDSGREGEMARVSFSPRARELVLYLADFRGRDDMLARLGKHRTGKACLYVKRLADVDTTVLEQLIAASYAEMRVRHPEG